MKKTLSIIFLSILLFSCGNGQNNAQQYYSAPANGSKALTVANWNIEWFGSGKEGPYDKDLQESNVLKVLQYMPADIYGLCEIVDTARFGSVVRALGSQYAYVISDYAANATNDHSQGWREGQKMVFLYKRSLFKNVRVRGFMRSSRKAYYNFSNGRLPYLLEADVQNNNHWQSMAFLLLHAKSGNDVQSYNRRLYAAMEMQDSIAEEFATMPLILLGDFNDILNGSITQGQQQSPYSIFLSENYKALTMSLAQKGERSTLHYKNIIDQQIVNKACMSYYVKGSTQVRKDVINAVPEYRKGNTSDHYPVTSQFSWDISHTITAPQKADNDNRIQMVNNHFQNVIELHVTTMQQNLQFILYDAQRQKVLSVHKQRIAPDKNFFLRCREIPNGPYQLVVYSGEGKQVFDVVKE